MDHPAVLTMIFSRQSPNMFPQVRGKQPKFLKLSSKSFHWSNFNSRILFFSKPYGRREKINIESNADFPTLGAAADTVSVTFDPTTSGLLDLTTSGFDK